MFQKNMENIKKLKHINHYKYKKREYRKSCVNKSFRDKI